MRGLLEGFFPVWEGDRAAARGAEWVSWIRFILMESLSFPLE